MTPVNGVHTIAVPVIVPAASGPGFTVITTGVVDATPEPQGLVPCTVRFPPVAPEGNVIVMAFVVCPLKVTPVPE